MGQHTDAEVIIGGRVFKLSGDESEEYMQKVANYLNGKLAECRKLASFKNQPVDVQNLLIQLNIADDYFKMKQQVRLLQEQAEEKEKELYDIKHELITNQMKMENLEKSVKRSQTSSKKSDSDKA